ncbi:hypothetical protein GQ607_005112 [Colletotrichum asianum]|uniref:Secreted protein n=1 Tax=Colletotrichum asianum TaxID=702518 RepID=A0A8H3WGF1_9PEZI|nr:hypothetical protein GQ607_005112 [Colletotrichum asianum]
MSRLALLISHIGIIPCHANPSIHPSIHPTKYPLHLSSHQQASPALCAIGIPTGAQPRDSHTSLLCSSSVSSLHDHSAYEKGPVTHTRLHTPCVRCFCC